MPTGYTAKLYESEQTFAEYLWTCARAFGALVSMRDLALDAPVNLGAPDEDSAYHRGALAEAQHQLEQLSATPLEKLQKAWEKEQADDRKSHEKKREIEALRRERYKAMREEVEAWEPPTDEHRDLKRFMLEQLSTCGSETSSYYDREFEEVPLANWVQNHKESLQATIEYHQRAMTLATRQKNSRLEWLRDLNESVPIPEDTGHASKRYK